jgi:ribonuclease P protein component
MAHTVSTLKKRADYVRLRRGKRAVMPCFILRAMPAPSTPMTGVRVGYTVTSKCGNAVLRNRIKRRFRALARDVFPANGKPGYDYLLIARDDASPGADKAEFAALHQALMHALAQVHR